MNLDFEWLTGYRLLSLSSPPYFDGFVHIMKHNAVVQEKRSFALLKLIEV
ncbi:hypothetical protein [Bacillus solimangrovi]|nr:hypothetical protein [Bacillus solimangrovi]